MDINPSSTRIALDLSRYHARHTHGDLTVYLTWYGTDQRRPAIVITPSYRIGWEVSTPCIVPLETAWAWDETVGDPRHCARTTAAFLAALGIPVSIQSAVRLTSLIRDHLGDLLAMPPEPVELVEVGDVIRIDQDGREHHSVIRERDNA